MRNHYTKELLEPIIRESRNWAEVCRILGVLPATGSQTHLKKKATEFEIDFSHFLGSASNLGRKFGPKKSIQHYLTENSSINSSELKQRLIKDGLKEARCEECGIVEWRGEPAPLELDHINRIHNDNRLENLQILCPMCHALKTRRDRRYVRVCQSAEQPPLEGVKCGFESLPGYHVVY